MHAGKGVADELEVPDDLDADDARTRGLAYMRDFRGDLADMLSSALQKGARLGEMSCAAWPPASNMWPRPVVRLRKDSDTQKAAAGRAAYFT